MPLQDCNPFFLYLPCQTFTYKLDSLIFVKSWLVERLNHIQRPQHGTKYIHLVEKELPRRQLSMSLGKSVFVLLVVFHFCLSIFYVKVSQHDIVPVNFPSIWKYCYRKAKVCIVIQLPHIAESCSAVWAVCWIVTNAWLRGSPWRHRTKSMSTYPLGGFSNHRSTRLTQYTVICPAGTLSNTYYIFLLLFKNTPALMHCEKLWWFPSSGQNGWSLHFPSMSSK